MPPNTASEQSAVTKPSLDAKLKDFEPEDRPGRPPKSEIALDKFFTPEAKGIMARMSGKVSEFTTRLYEKVAQSERLSGGMIEQKMGALAARMDIWFHKKLEEGALKAKTRDTKTEEREERKAKRLLDEANAADEAFAKMKEIAEKLEQPLSAKTEIVFADKKKGLKNQADAIAKKREEGAQRIAEAENRYKEYRAEIEGGVTRLTEHVREKVRGNTWEVMENMTGIAAMEEAVKAHGEVWEKHKKNLDEARKHLEDPKLSDYASQLKAMVKNAEKAHSEASAVYTKAQEELQTVRTKIEKLLEKNKAHLEGISKIDAKYLTDAERKTRADHRVKELEAKAQTGDWEGALKVAQTTGDFEMVRRVATLAADQGEKEVADKILRGIPESENAKPTPAAKPGLALGALQNARKTPPPTPVPPAARRVGGLPTPGGTPPSSFVRHTGLPTGAPRLSMVPPAPAAEARPATNPDKAQEEEAKTLKMQLSDFRDNWNVIHSDPADQLTLSDLECDNPEAVIEDTDELAMEIKKVISKNKPSVKISLAQIIGLLPRSDIFQAAA